MCIWWCYKHSSLIGNWEINLLVEIRLWTLSNCSIIKTMAWVAVPIQQFVERKLLNQILEYWNCQHYSYIIKTPKISAWVKLKAMHFFFGLGSFSSFIKNVSEKLYLTELGPSRIRLIACIKLYLTELGPSRIRLIACIKLYLTEVGPSRIRLIACIKNYTWQS